MPIAYIAQIELIAETLKSKYLSSGPLQKKLADPQARTKNDNPVIAWHKTEYRLKPSWDSSKNSVGMGHPELSTP